MTDLVLTDQHMKALRVASKAPFNGFPAGSNIWPLTVLDPEGTAVDGEIIDELLRANLLAAVSLIEPVAGERSPNLEFAPDLDFEHQIVITTAGRAKLSPPGGDE